MLEGFFAGLPLDLLLSPWALAVLGLAVGSFLNVVVHRLPLMLERQWWGDVGAQLADGESYQRTFGHAMPERLALASSSLEKSLADLAPLGLARPASRCPACGHRIRWFENIPVLSWLALRGKCSACGTKIGLRYPLVEIATALLFGALGWLVGPQPLVLLWCAVAATLLAIGVTLAGTPLLALLSAGTIMIGPFTGDDLGVVSIPLFAALSAFGILLLFVTLHLARGVAVVHGAIAKHLLVKWGE